MFSTRNNNSKRRISAFLTYGSHQPLKINDFEVRNFGGTSTRINFKMEGEPIKAEGFSPVDGAEGQVGTVIARSYIKTERDQQQFVSEVVVPIALALGVIGEVDRVEANTFEEYLDKVKPIITGKFANWLVGAREYLSSDGQNRVKYNLQLPRYGFVEAIGKEESRMAKFDKGNKYHYQPVAKPEEAPAEKEVTSFKAQEDEDSPADLPF